MKRLLVICIVLLALPAAASAQSTPLQDSGDAGPAPLLLIVLFIVAAAVTWLVSGTVELEPQVVEIEKPPELETAPEPKPEPAPPIEQAEPPDAMPEVEMAEEAEAPEPEPAPRAARAGIEPALEPVAEVEVSEPAAEMQPAEAEAPVEVEAEPSEPDDLRIIEGIGPKVSEALQGEGITTFEQVAALAPQDLEKLVKDAGVRIIKGASQTWPEQAALAAEGKWDELETLQGELKGGRRA